MIKPATAQRSGAPVLFDEGAQRRVLAFKIVVGGGRPAVLAGGIVITRGDKKV